MATPDHHFLTVCTSDKLACRRMQLSGPCEIFRQHVLLLDIHTHALFSRVRIGLSMMVSGLNHLPRRMKQVRLCLEWVTHLSQCCRRANKGPRVINHDSTTLRPWERSEIAHFGTLEASRRQTKPTMEGVTVVYGRLEQVGKRPACPEVTDHDDITLGTSRKH